MMESVNKEGLLPLGSKNDNKLFKAFLKSHLSLLLPVDASVLFFVLLAGPKPILSGSSMIKVATMCPQLSCLQVGPLQVRDAALFQFSPSFSIPPILTSQVVRQSSSDGVQPIKQNTSQSSAPANLPKDYRYRDFPGQCLSTIPDSLPPSLRWHLVLFVLP